MATELSRKVRLFQLYAEGIPQQLQTHVHSAVTTKTSTAVC